MLSSQEMRAAAFSTKLRVLQSVPQREEEMYHISSGPTLERSAAHHCGCRHRYTDCPTLHNFHRPASGHRTESQPGQKQHQTPVPHTAQQKLTFIRRYLQRSQADRTFLVRCLPASALLLRRSAERPGPGPGPEPEPEAAGAVASSMPAPFSRVPRDSDTG